MKRSFLLTLVLVSAFSLTLGSSLRAAPDADNSGKNAVDKSGETVTPIDQSNAQADIDVTTAIRKAVIADDSLSSNAHNIKIVTTENHVVYLRGPVASTDEIAKIVKIAKQNSGKYPVKNQLSVAK